MTFLETLSKLTAEEQAAEVAKVKKLADEMGRANRGAIQSGSVVWEEGRLVNTQSSSTELTGSVQAVIDAKNANADLNTIDYSDPDQAGFAAWLEGQGLLDTFINKEGDWGMFWDNYMLGGGKEGNQIYGGEGGSGNGDPPSGGLDTKGTPGDTEVITSTLRRWGFSADEVSGLAGWIQTQIQSGVPPESVLLLVMDQPQFKARFPGMQAAIDAGYGPPSPDEYIMYEDSLRELVDKWLPGETVGNVDTLITTLMGGNISIQQVRDRLQIAYDEILNAPVDVKSWFMSEYGEAGDGMLASVLLDPNKDFTDLEQVAKEAYTQAASDQILGESITKGVAKNIANLGMTQEAQYRQFRDLSRQELLYAEKITEDTDLKIEVEGVTSAFGTDTESMNAVEQRIEERGAAFGGGGGAVVGQRGATGFGSANA